MFSGVISRNNSSNEGLSTALIATFPGDSTCSTNLSPSASRASSATFLGIRTAKLFPHRTICACAFAFPMGTSPPEPRYQPECIYIVYTAGQGYKARVFSGRNEIAIDGE